MGGLVTKQLLVESKLRADRQHICNSTKLVVFYGTPHKGSKLAEYATVLQSLAQTTVAVEDLILHGRHLQTLDRYFNFLNLPVVNFGTVSGLFLLEAEG